MPRSKVLVKENPNQVLCRKCGRPKRDESRRRWSGLTAQYVVDYYCNCGRPSIMTQSIIDRLLIAFSYGCTNAEACQFAGINDRTLKKFFDEEPGFKEFCMQSKLKPIMMARKAVIDAFESKPELALKFLERVKKDEFGPTAKLEHKHSITLEGILSEIMDGSKNIVDERIIEVKQQEGSPTALEAPEQVPQEVLEDLGVVETEEGESDEIITDLELYARNQGVAN